MQKLKRILSIIALIILIPILIISGVILINSYVHPDEVPSFFGWKPFIVLSGSMETQISVGDIVVVKEVATNTLKKGDIIAFKSNDIVITHRIDDIIVEDGKTKYITKGDNNNAEDSGIISYEMIEGKVVKHISQIGKIAIILQKKGTIIFIILILYIYILYSSSIKKKRALRKLKREEFESKRLEEEYEQKK